MLTREQMEAHLALLGWRAVRWDSISAITPIITHPDAGFFFFDPVGGTAKSGATFAEGIVEKLPVIEWKEFDSYELQAIFSHLSSVGAI